MTAEFCRDQQTLNRDSGDAFEFTTIVTPMLLVLRAEMLKRTRTIVDRQTSVVTKTSGFFFLKHSQWPPKASALPSLRATATSEPSLDF
uniref:Uncharacterized protein n=1 Tax=Physcomitrium patens TaxID=3218 RepID=A0A2K1J9R9_PHYPA|nr:hypothetical protein PHYPA_021383 [Physcomitrium patens]